MKQFPCLYSRVLPRLLIQTNKAKAAAMQNDPESRKTKLLSPVGLRQFFFPWTVYAMNFTTTSVVGVLFLCVGFVLVKKYINLTPTVAKHFAMNF